MTALPGPDGAGESAQTDVQTDAQADVQADVQADADRVARVLLSGLSEPGDRVLGAYVRRVGAREAAAALRAGAASAHLPARHAERYAVRLGGRPPSEVLGSAVSMGARYVIPGDREWPTQLDDLGDARPLGLWVRGRADLRRWALRSVAVVGARACTEYGRTVAADLSAALADRDWTVVSGAAFGIDGAAHRGSMALGGPTVAVLACGVDVPYPRGHEVLIGRMVSEGLVVSELPPGTGVTKGRFLQRNRVIAALTRGTVVVEAALRSGALNTAAHARNASRLVMAVPGPVTSALSAGCHELVRTAHANLVTDAADVLDLVGALGIDAQPLRRGTATPVDDLDSDTLRALDALPARRVAGLDALAASAGLDVPTLSRCLIQLESVGLAESRAGGWRMPDGRNTREVAQA